MARVECVCEKSKRHSDSAARQSSSTRLPKRHAADQRSPSSRPRAQCLPIPARLPRSTPITPAAQRAVFTSARPYDPSVFEFEPPADEPASRAAKRVSFAAAGEPEDNGFGMAAASGSAFAPPSTHSSAGSGASFSRFRDARPAVGLNRRILARSALLPLSRPPRSRRGAVKARLEQPQASCGRRPRARRRRVGPAQSRGRPGAERGARDAERAAAARRAPDGGSPSSASAKEKKTPGRGQRPCSTPGCTLIENHLGACTSQQVQDWLRAASETKPSWPCADTRRR